MDTCAKAASTSCSLPTNGTFMRCLSQLPRLLQLNSFASFLPHPSPASPPHPTVSISAVIFSTSCRKRAISGSSVSNTRPTQTDLMEIYRREAMQLWGAFLKRFSVLVLRMEFIYLMFGVAAILSTVCMTYSTYFFFSLFFTRIPVKSCYTAHFWSNSSQLLTLPS